MTKSLLEGHCRATEGAHQFLIRDFVHFHPPSLWANLLVSEDMEASERGIRAPLTPLQSLGHNYFPLFLGSMIPLNVVEESPLSETLMATLIAIKLLSRVFCPLMSLQMCKSGGGVGTLVTQELLLSLEEPLEIGHVSN